MNPRLHLDETTLARFCERHYIRRLSLFGSQLKVQNAPTVTSICWWSSSRVGCRVCWPWPAWNWSFPSSWAGNESIYGRRKTFPTISATR